MSRPAPELPRPLAARLDRLARGAHAFHRWSHHPLCTAYEGEVIRIGRRTRVCRGCALAGAGVVSGAAVALAASPVWSAAGAAVGIAAWVAAGATPTPTSTSTPTPPRRPKLLTRFLPAALSSGAATLGLRSATLTGAAVALLAAAAGALVLARYRRRGPDRSPCAACPERALARTCSGLRPIARREAAFRRAAARLIVGG